MLHLQVKLHVTTVERKAKKKKKKKKKKKNKHFTRL